MSRIAGLLMLAVFCGCGGDGNDAVEKPSTTNTATEFVPLEEGEREVPGTVSDKPSGHPDLSDPNIDTSVMPR